MCCQMLMLSDAILEHLFFKIFLGYTPDPLTFSCLLRHWSVGLPKVGIKLLMPECSLIPKSYSLFPYFL